MPRTNGRSPSAAIRQWRFPRALRITPVESPPAGLEELVEAVRRSLEAAGGNGSSGGAAPAERTRPAAERDERTSPPEPGEPGEPVEPAIDDRILANLATGLWRARRRMLGPDRQAPRPEVRKEFRHVQAAWDALAAAEVRVQDHDGARYVPGLALDVLVFQPTAGLEHEEVVETIRPSVYLRGRPIQLGQVIVGTPGEEGGER